jgi:hypothetical protein
VKRFADTCSFRHQKEGTNKRLRFNDSAFAFAIVFIDNTDGVFRGWKGIVAYVVYSSVVTAQMASEGRPAAAAAAAAVPSDASMAAAAAAVPSDAWMWKEDDKASYLQVPYKLITAYIKRACSAVDVDGKGLIDRVVSLGSGNGRFEYHLRNDFAKDPAHAHLPIICVDPEPTTYKPYHKVEFTRPDHKDVDELCAALNRQKPAPVGICLLINWASTTARFGAYDLMAIIKLQPRVVISVYDQTGSAGTMSFHKWIHGLCGKPNGVVHDARLAQQEDPKHVRKFTIASEYTAQLALKQLKYHVAANAFHDRFVADGLNELENEIKFAMEYEIRQILAGTLKGEKLADMIAESVDARVGVIMLTNGPGFLTSAGLPVTPYHRQVKVDRTAALRYLANELSSRLSK